MKRANPDPSGDPLNRKDQRNQKDPLNQRDQQGEENRESEEKRGAAENRSGRTDVPARGDEAGNKAGDEPSGSEETGSGLGRFLLKLGIIAGACWAVLTFVIGLHRVSGNEMYPALHDGDLVITYRLEAPVKGDVVVYEEDGVRRAGRVIGTEGDTVAIESGGVVLNGSPVSEEVLYDTDAGPMDGEVSIGENEYFILNDFRSDMSDSRQNGNIKKEQLCGKAVFVLRRRGF